MSPKSLYIYNYCASENAWKSCALRQEISVCRELKYTFQVVLHKLVELLTG